jgi:hypothetical protein
VGNQLRRFVSFSRCWDRSPPPLPTILFPNNKLGDLSSRQKAAISSEVFLAHRLDDTIDVIWSVLF